MAMIRNPAKVAILSVMLLGLPIIGIILCGLPLRRYLEFPPKTIYVTYPSFSWPIFFGYLVFVFLVLSPFLRRALSGSGRGREIAQPRSKFPWWGWIGIFMGAITWVLAWTRFSWFRDFQAHTFTPLWLAYIITINAFTYRRTGNCPLLDHPVPFLLLFPASALFWWFFEYLNRFVQNWYYVGPFMGPMEYICYATLAFSTVLPAFTATREWVLSYSWPEKFRGFPSLSVSRPRAFAVVVLGLSGIGLTGLGVFPAHLFSLLWLSPLLILVSLKTLFGEPHVFSSLRKGDWQLLVASAVSALICGLFWEMWNFYSLAKWIYRIPYVEGFRIFEMPLIGYAGYLPFGAECAVIVEMVLADWSPARERKKHFTQEAL